MTRQGFRRLRAVREVQGKSLREVARRIAVDPAYLSRIERGLQQPSLPTLMALLLELGQKDTASAITRLLEEQ